MSRWLAYAAVLPFLAASMPTRVLADPHADLPPSHSVQPELYATGFEFAEGPTLDRHGNLFVVNYRGNGNIGRIAPDGSASVWCDLSQLAPVDRGRPQANGLKVDGEGRLIVADAGGGRVLRLSRDGSHVEVLAERHATARFNAINDVALDLAGNIYFTDPGGSSETNAVGSVYRYDINTKRVSTLVGDLAFPNGLAITPDQKHLCLSESKRFRLLIFDLSAGGEVLNARVLMEFPAETMGQLRGGRFEPDGMIFDRQGRLYVAMWTGGVVNVVDVSTGTLIRQYDAGGDKATNCHFHGPYLYTTVAAKEAVFRLKLDVEGFAYNAAR